MSDYFCRRCKRRLTAHEEMGLPFECDKNDPETMDNDLCEDCYARETRCPLTESLLLPKLTFVPGGKKGDDDVH